MKEPDFTRLRSCMLNALDHLPLHREVLDEWRIDHVMPATLLEEVEQAERFLKIYKRILKAEVLRAIAKLKTSRSSPQEEGGDS